MGKERKQSAITVETKEYIQTTAKVMAEEMAEKLINDFSGGPVNYYRAVENLLYNYLKLKALVEDEEEYLKIEVKERSSSLTKFSPGAGYRSKGDILEELEQQKMISYRRTKARFEEVQQVIDLFKERKEFRVIQMYYFNLDAQGNQRPNEAEQYTFEEIAYELSELGILRESKTARRWRSRIINDMAVCMFGKPAAISAGIYRSKNV